jgi:hypothetical protein
MGVNMLLDVEKKKRPGGKIWTRYLKNLYNLGTNESHSSGNGA